MSVLKRLLLAGVITTSLPVFANTYVICGETVDIETSTVKGYELELSSEGADEYKGPVGKLWQMKLEDQSSNWLSANENIVARNYVKGDDHVVEIIISQARSASGFVGTLYKLTGLYDEQPTLEKFTMGGFAGTIRVGHYQCLTGND